MKKAALMLLLSACAMFADVTGKWSGEASQGDENHALIFNLKEDGKTVTGTGGPGEDRQIAIEAGSVEGDRIKFSVKPPNMTLDFDLKVSGDSISGTVHGTTGDGAVQDLKVTLKRVKS